MKSKLRKSITITILVIILCLSNGLINNIKQYNDKDIQNTQNTKNTMTLVTADWTGPIKYDFESDTIGQNPTGENLTIYEPAGCGYIEVNNVASRKCTIIAKTMGGDRVYLRDDIGDANYTAGEIHFQAYHDYSGFAVVLESAKNENLIDMVWWEGNIRRNGPSGPILTTYTYDTWIEVVIYFDLSQGWMFDLDGTRFGDGYAYPFTGTFTTNASHILWASFFGGGGEGDFCVDDIGYDNLVKEILPRYIKIVTPEEKTYFEPMSGYYPATYGFENEEDGAFPTRFIDQVLPGCDITIFSELDGHKKILDFDDPVDSAHAAMRYNLTTPQIFGTFEFWIRTSDVNKPFSMELQNSTYHKLTGFQIANSAWKVALPGIGWTITPELGTPLSNHWYHVRIDFECTNGEYTDLPQYHLRFTINETLSCIKQFLSNCSQLEAFYYWTSISNFGYHGYLDALGFSWDPSYKIGDNLKEGLLLSYKNSTVLDWVGYSLDGNAKITIYGNTTFSMPGGGSHTIQVFGNNSLGKKYCSDIRSFSILYNLTGNPVFIDDSNPNYNWSKTAIENLWCSGSGTWSDPYIIGYVLIDGKNIGSCITINNSNVYFIIRNCETYNAGGLINDAGIKLENTNNGTLTNNNCSDNNRYGIFLLNGCKNNTISGNIASNVGTMGQDHGIHLENYCHNNTIIGNSANDNMVNGIDIYNGCENNTISDNNAGNKDTTYQDSGIVIHTDCDCNIISNNNVNNNTFYGIYVTLSDYNNISGNEATWNHDSGIFLDNNCHHNNITNNIAINNFKYGIYLSFICQNNTIFGNSANNEGTMNQQVGIQFETSCSYNIIMNNKIMNNTMWGIYMNIANYNNTISENIIGNIGTNYQDTGIYMSGSCINNTISRNLIINHQICGIEINTADCELNLIYHNAFIGTNGWHAYDSGINNQWNKSGIGNYWDNHTSPDSDHNGIVDIPYTWITGNSASKDYYPLAESPIHIGGKISIDDAGVNAPNWSRTAKLNFWCSGSGVWNDPYVIDGLIINGSSSGSCITINNSNVYFIIKNCKTYNSGGGINDAGIKLDNTKNGTIRTNNCTNNNYCGILLINNCENNTISGNIAANVGTTNQDIGIYLDINCYNNTIVNNEANNNMDYGIYLYDGCNNNTISGNIACNEGTTNQDVGIFLNCSCNENTIKNNTANNNILYGVHLLFSDNNTISRNNYTFNNNGICGIFLEGSNWNNITNNIITFNAKYGICLNSSSYNNIFYNNCTGNPIPLYQDPYCVGNVFIGNLPITPTPKLPILPGGDDDEKAKTKEESVILFLSLIIIIIASIAVVIGIALIILRKRRSSR